MTFDKPRELVAADRSRLQRYTAPQRDVQNLRDDRSATATTSLHGPNSVSCKGARDDSTSRVATPPDEQLFRRMTARRCSILSRAGSSKAWARAVSFAPSPSDALKRRDRNPPESHHCLRPRARP